MKISKLLDEKILTESHLKSLSILCLILVLTFLFFVLPITAKIQKKDKNIKEKQCIDYCIKTEGKTSFLETFCSIKCYIKK